MKRLLILAAGAAALGLAGIPPTISVAPALAQSSVAAVEQVQTTTFSVPSMYCALCPVTVRKAMEGVEGVRSVEIDFDARTATVVFDASVATPEAIAAASTNAGYPATAGS